MEKAIALARQPENARAAFHRRYTVFPAGDPIVDRFEIVTEMRRLVLAVERRRRLGSDAFSLNDARTVLQPWRGRLSIVAHLRFHPLNVLVSVPDYELRLAASGAPTLRPLDTRRRALYGTPAAPRALPSAPGSFLAGSEIEGVFDGAAVGNRAWTLLLLLGQKEIARAAMNFAAID
jgi:hypothetical protein